MPAQHDRLNFLRPLVILACLGIVFCVLYFARAVLIPLALAVLLSFLLAPVVTSLERRLFGRLPAILTVVVVAMLIFAGIGWMVASQATTLVDTFPEYEENLEEKIDTIRAMSQGGLIERLQVVMDRLRTKINEPTDSDKAAAKKSPETAPQPVRVVEPEQGPFNLAAVWALAGPLLEPFATAGLVIVLVIFLLIRREDMRDRMISLLGQGRMTLTTKALDDAAQRISRYLLMQLIINGSFGAAVAAGLFVLDVPFALLWGFLAAVLRYIPYVGPWLAAILPLALSILITRGWTTPLMVVGLFLVLEVTTNIFLEPWLYGRNVGVSDAAAIVAIAIWTWLWGPIGLVLAFPLTVCLAVLGRYVPALKFLDTLLGDRPALEPHMGFYQRLLARDQDEACDIAEERLKSTSLEGVFDEVLVPALNFARRDLESDLIDGDEQKALLEAVDEISEDLAARSRKAGRSEVSAGSANNEAVPLPRVMVLACPARDETDETALRMLERLIDSDQCDLRVTTSALLSTEVAAFVEEHQIKVVCIASVPPGGLAHARYLCMRLRARFGMVKIVVGRWGVKNPREENREPLLSAGADYVGFSLTETRNQIITLLPVAAAQDVSASERRETDREPVKQSA
jgi:predicted PurR-regulated permease PerM